MPFVKVALPGHPRGKHAHRQVKIYSRRYGSITLTITDPEVEHADIAAEWAELPRADNYPLLEKKAGRLRSFPIHARIGRQNEEPVEHRLNLLRKIARGDDVFFNNWVHVSYGPSEAGRWRMTGCTIKSVEREQGTNAITLAEVTLTFTARGEIVRVPSSVKKKHDPDRRPKPVFLPGQVGPALSSRSHVVQQGETLARIALGELGDADLWLLIAQLNALRTATVTPGQMLLLPDLPAAA